MNLIDERVVKDVTGYSNTNPYSKEDIVFLLREFTINEGRIPSKKDYLRVSLPTILKHFGSWNNAIKAANLDSLIQEEKYGSI